jgi:hypothetical protein
MLSSASDRLPVDFIPELVIFHNVVKDFPCPDGLAAAWVVKKWFNEKQETFKKQHNNVSQSVNSNISQNVNSNISQNVNSDVSQNTNSNVLENNIYDIEKHTIRYLGCCYDDPAPDLIAMNIKKVLVVDFSFDYEVLEFWKSQDIQCFVIDHHKAFIQNLVNAAKQKNQGLNDQLRSDQAKVKTYSLTKNVLNSVFYDIQECGATLTHKILFPGQELPAFLEYVRDRDLFIKALPDSDYVHAACGSLRRSFALFDQLAELDQSMLIDFLKPIGTPSIEKKKIKIDKYLNSPKFFTLILQVSSQSKNIAIPVVELNKSDISLKGDIGEAICFKYPDSPFCLVLNRSESSVIRLRSSMYTQNVDLVKLFADQGCGGHPGASNFHFEADSSNNKTFKEQLETLILSYAQKWFDDKEKYTAKLENDIDLKQSISELESILSVE